MENLIKIQNELKVPKGKFNSFGKYNYRTAEGILEAVKPLLSRHNSLLTLSDSIESIGDKLFLKATAVFTCELGTVQVSGYAEMGEHKGMSSEQCTGCASSYARKYALNGLFCIDETESDHDNDYVKEQVEKGKKQVPAQPQTQSVKYRPSVENCQTFDNLLKSPNITKDIKERSFKAFHAAENEFKTVSILKYLEDFANGRI